LRTLAITPGASAVTLPPAASAPIALPYNMNVFGHRGASAKDNGAFDAAGSTFPAEMIADTITSEGIAFKIGPRAKGKNEPNALRCEGQAIALPAGNFNCVYLLATAQGGDTDGQFTIAGKDSETQTTTLRVQNWNGYIGQWDNRVFKGEVPEHSYNVENPLARIDAGYIKRDPVAWYSDHYYTKGGKDALYEYCYLFKYALPVPAGAKTLTLPKNPNIRILAMTAARDPAAGTRPARPLYDDFTGRKPIVIPEGWAKSN
jgi:alpha-mannosidase